MACTVNLFRSSRSGDKCDRIAQFHKASQFLGWIMRNVIHTDKIPFTGVFEISKDQLEQLLEACNQVRRYGITYIRTEHTGGYTEHIYEVSEPIARTFLPIHVREGYLMFPYEYSAGYAVQVIDAIRTLNEILVTTNFEEQGIYFRYS